MIDLSLTVGRLTFRLAWKPTAPKPPVPQSTPYPMRVSAPLGFGRRTIRGDIT